MGLVWPIEHLYICIHICEWYMTRLVVKNGNERDMCCNDIELCAQN